MMTQKKFLKMTKPSKIYECKRRMKGVVSVIKYRWCIILYKLHLLKRYSYRDHGTRSLFPEGCPFDLGPSKIETNLIVADAVPEITIDVDTDLDYFYWSKKNHLKRFYTVTDHYREVSKMTVTPKNIGLKVNGRVYTSKLPQLRIATLMPENRPLAFISPDEPVSRMEYQTLTYDLKKVEHYVVNTPLYLSSYPDYIVREVFQQCRASLQLALSNLTLLDLEVKTDDI